MELLRLLLFFAAVTFAGYIVLCLVMGRAAKFYRSEALVISFGLGIGLVTLETLIFSMTGIGLTPANLAAPWLVLAALNLVLINAGRKPAFLRQEAASGKGRGMLDIFLVFGISFEVVYAFFRALVKPIEAYDAVAIYAIKSKIFYLAGAIPEEFFSRIAAIFPHPDYPLNIPLAQTLGYWSMGVLNDQLIKLIFPLFFVGILALLYFAVRRFAGRTYALVFTFLLASVPQFNAYAANAYLEVPLAFYCFASIVFLLWFIEDTKATGLLVMSAVMAGLAGWTKNEGLLYCVINMVILCVFLIARRRSARDVLYPLLYGVVIALIALPWILIKAKWHIVNDEINMALMNPFYLAKQFHKLGPIFYELQKQLFGPKKWNILWPAFFVAIVFGYRKLVSSEPAKYLALSVVLALGGYVAFYMISYVDVVFFASKTWSRFLLNFLPALVLLMAVLLKEDIKL